MIVTTASAQVETKSAGVGISGTQADSQKAPRGDHRRTRAHRRRSVELRGPAGRLEAVLNEGAPDAPFAALVCHPHPLGGGTLHNKVVYHAMKVLNDPAWGFGLPVLRFNFRGTGLSEGAHDGEAETDDVLAALDWLENEFKLPLVVGRIQLWRGDGAEGLLHRRAPRQRVRALLRSGCPSKPRAALTIIPFCRTPIFPNFS